MNLVRFHFSILPCTYLKEPFQHVHLLPTLRETTLQSDRQQTCPELGITFPCAALRYSHAKLSGSRQAERMDSNHQDLVYNQAVPSYLHIPNNPDSRVSKVFNVSCLPRVVSGACPPIYLLQGGAYCLYDRIDSNDTCRKLHPLFNLQIPPEPVSVKDTHQRKEESMKKMFMSSGCNHLRIFPMNIFYHKVFKKLWYMF